MKSRLAQHGGFVSILGLALLGLAACAASPVTRFYVLTPVAVDGVQGSRVSPVSGGMTIGIRAVELPEELDRPQIVTRTGTNTVHLAEFDRWSAPLRDSVRQVIGDNLTILLPADRVERYPWTPGTALDREVIVEVTRFDGELGGQCTLNARWKVLTRTAPTSALYGHSMLSEAAGGDYAALVATQSRLLGALSAEIARAIRTGTQTASPSAGSINTD